MKTFWLISLSIGAFQGYFIGLIFLLKRDGCSPANKIMGTILLLLALMVSEYLALLLEAFTLWPHLSSITFPIWFLIAPLFYYYLKTLLLGRLALRWQAAAHFLPFALVVYMSLPIYAAWSPFSVFETRVSLLTLYAVQMIGYILASGLILKRYEVSFKKQQAQSLPAHFSWLKIVLSVFVVFLILDTTTFYLLYFEVIYLPWSSFFSVLALSSFSCAIAFTAIMNPQQIFPLDKNGEKYPNSSITAEEAERYKVRLQTIMHESRPYLDQQLSLRKLADLLEVQPYQLSQVINQEFNQNFSDFVNSFRVEKAQKRLLDDASRKYTIAAIGQEVGFNSRASFYRIFKQTTGQTPSKFIESQHPSRAQG